MTASFSKLTRQVIISSLSIQQYDELKKFINEMAEKQLSEEKNKSSRIITAKTANENVLSSKTTKDEQDKQLEFENALFLEIMDEIYLSSLMGVRRFDIGYLHTHVNEERFKKRFKELGYVLVTGITNGMYHYESVITW